MDTLKFAIVGEIATGKTSVLRRYLYNTFKENYDLTLGVDLASKNIVLQDKPVRCEFWDTTGEERFHSLCKIFYKNAHIIFIVYDITKRMSFEAIRNYWINEINNNTAETSIIDIYKIL